MKNNYHMTPIPILPVAKFYYRGGHSHPVRRTIVIIAETEETFTGCEFREGNVVRSTMEAVNNVKIYRKDKIAKWGDYSRIKMTAKGFFKHPEDSTLERYPISYIHTMAF